MIETLDIGYREAKKYPDIGFMISTFRIYPEPLSAKPTYRICQEHSNLTPVSFDWDYHKMPKDYLGRVRAEIVLQKNTLEIKKIKGKRTFANNEEFREVHNKIYSILLKIIEIDRKIRSCW